MRIRNVLEEKGFEVCSAQQETPVRRILAMLVEHNIGAIILLDGEAVVGMVSQRDVVHALHELGGGILDTPACEVMTAPIFSCGPEDTVDDVSRVMTDRRHRHVPVLDDGMLIGIVSVGDVVKQRVAQLEAHREQLESYIVQG
jgi:CBS domain-containing protein